MENYGIKREGEYMRSLVKYSKNLIKAENDGLLYKSIKLEKGVRCK